MNHWARTVLSAVCLATGAAAMADCATTRSATTADLAGGKGDLLLKSIDDACKSQKPDNFFRLQAEGANRILSGKSAAEKKQIFSQYCGVMNEAIGKLGKDLGSAVHSIGPYKNRTKCGAPTSFWFVHDRSGELVIRLEIGVEAGQLKIDTH